MTWRGQEQLADAIARWVTLCQRAPYVVVLFSLILTAVSTAYLATNFRINTDNEDMLSADLQFRQNAIAVDHAFPQLDGNMLIVLEASNLDLAEDALVAMVAALRQETNVFLDVYAPETDPFFRRNGLLYLDLEELENLSSRLISAQPFLGILWQSPNLGGLSELLDLFSQGGSQSAETYDAVNRILDQMSHTIERLGSGEMTSLEWTSLLSGDDERTVDVARKLIVVKPTLKYDSLQPAEAAIDRILSVADQLNLVAPDYGIRLTGSAALEDDELRSVEEGMGLAGLLSLTLVTFILFFGLRSVGMVASLFVTLVFGLVWTAGLAIVTIGSFNLISVAFAVLFVGLSVDFGIHFTLRCREHADASTAWGTAIIHGAKSVGPSLALCAVTTSIAFFAFWPTSYRGLAELGFISGIGMFVALFANLTLLPALLKICVRKKSASSFGRPLGSSIIGHRRVARAIILVAGLSVIGALLVAPTARFDFDPMNLRDAESPSMLALKDIAHDGLITPYSAEVLSEDIEDLRKIADGLTRLDSVDRVENVETLIPSEQEEKLEIIDELALVLGPSFFSPQGTISFSPEESANILMDIKARLDKLRAIPELSSTAGRMKYALSQIAYGQLDDVNEGLFSGLVGRLRSLADSLEPSKIDLQELPENVLSSYVSASGIYRTEIVPRGDVRNSAELREFVEDVRSVTPDATGSPVIILEAGKAVLDAFLQALLTAVAAITVIVWIVMKRVRDVVLIFIPVAVAALWTIAVSALINLPFNFANVIVLPLLFGLSVDFGIHLVLRYRENGAIANAMATSTPRAILLSALTTLCSFGSIMLSGHPGTASMGALLTISILLSLSALLLLLPALLSQR